MSFLTDPEAFAKLAEESGLVKRANDFADVLADYEKRADDYMAQGRAFNATTQTPVQREAQAGSNAGPAMHAAADTQRSNEAASRLDRRANQTGAGQNAATAQGVNVNRQ